LTVLLRFETDQQLKTAVDAYAESVQQDFPVIDLPLMTEPSTL
jgi:hypothetical protein